MLGISLTGLLKWLLRLGLVGFWLAVIWYFMNDQNVIAWLAREHVTTTQVLVFLTVIAFMPMFFHIKRTNKSGGETEMRKLAWFAIIVFGIVLAVAVGAAISGDFKAGVSSFLLGLLGSMWVAMQNGWSTLTNVASASGTNFLIYTIIALLAGGILLVALNRAKASGKIPFVKKTVVSVPLQSGPDYIPGAVITQPYAPPVQPVAPTVQKEAEAEA